VSVLDNTTIIAHTTIILPVILYSYETWFVILGNEYRLTVTENRILSRTFGPKREEVTRGLKKTIIRSLIMCTLHQIIWMINEDEMGSMCRTHQRIQNVFTEF
jgi:hypothetical protein